MAARESPIVPSLGRIVLVRGGAVFADDLKREVPAIVTQVHSTNVLDVMIFDAASLRITGFTSISYDDVDPEVLHAAWRWMPYQLSTAAKESQTPAKGMTLLERVEEEEDELRIKFDKLTAFFATDAWTELSMAHRELLDEQHGAMRTYLTVLSKRLALLKQEASA